MSKAKRTARQEFTRVAEACGWTMVEANDDAGDHALFSRANHTIEVDYAIDGGVKLARCRTDGRIVELIATAGRRSRVLKALKASPW